MTTDASGPTLQVTNTIDSDGIRGVNPQVSVPTNTMEFDATAPADASDPNAVRAPSSVQTIQHYEMIRRLGEGGMGAVYLARDTKLGRLVAIKLLIEITGASTARFLVEARATARCKHENIVVIYEVDEHDGYPYMVLEHIDGQNLHDWMTQRHVEGFGPTAKNAPVPASLAIELMLPVVRALGCAHALGIVHRDLKPGNIMLDAAGPIKVLDFGIAKVREFPLAGPSHDTLASMPTNIELTHKGTIMGTMPYMSPEQWRRDEIDARTDIWAVGIMLFELVTGAHPLAPLTFDKCEKVGVLRLPMPSVFDIRPDIGPLGTVIDRCLAKQKEQRWGSADELRAALEALLPGQKAFELGDGDCPFTGLSAFQEADAGRFFGRDRDVAIVLTQLRYNPLLAIAGSSGAGKSSFVRAGLIPALKRLGEGWEPLLMRPGQHPLVALAELCARLAPHAGDHTTVLAQLREAPGFFGSTLRAYCRNTAHRLFVFIDQFEELYTLCSDEAERETFVACLTGAADDASSPVRIAFSIRSDFLDRLTEDRQLLTAVAKGLFLLPSMGRENLEMALVKPVEAMGYHFESANMVQNMLDALKSSSTPLPLLQFAATKLWEKRNREQRLLTIESYEALGGVAGALATHADAVIDNLSMREQQLARAIFLRLVTPERTRAVASLPDLREIDTDALSVEQVVDRLSEARLVHIEGGEDRAIATVELVHESLIERWPKLRNWLEESQEESAFLARVRPAAKQWDAGGSADDLLWRGQAAEDAERWQRRHGDAAITRTGTREARFVAAVVGLAARERIRRRRILATVVGALSVVVIVVSVLAVRAKRAATLAEDAGRATEEALGKAQIAENVAKNKAIEASDARLLAGFRELKNRGQLAWGTKLLFEISRPDQARDWIALASEAVASNALDATLRGHSQALTIAAWSPDGERVVTASADFTARLWNASGAGNSIVLSGHLGRVTAAAFSPDGKRVLTASEDGTARLWNVDGRNADGSGGSSTITVPGGPILFAAWNPDGTRIVTGSADAIARVWSADNTNRIAIAEFKGHSGSLTTVAFLSNDRVLTASEDGTARVWHVKGDEKPVVFKEHKGAVGFAAASPDGTRIVTASSDHTARIWNASGKGKSIVLEGHDDAVLHVAWSRDGKHIATASADRTARLWNADGDANPVVFSGHTLGVTFVSFRPDGRYLVTASRDRTARIWPVEGGEALELSGHDGPIVSALWNADGSRVLTAAGADEGGRSLDHAARVWHSGSLESLSRERRGFFHSAFVGLGGNLVASAYDDSTGRVWRVNGRDEPTVFTAKGHNAWVTSASLSPDGAWIATASFDKTARITRVDGAGEPVVLEGHTAAVRAVVFSPDGTHVITVSDDNTARIQSADGKSAPLQLEGHTDSLRSAAWSPDGKRVITTSLDRTARIWSADGIGPALVLKGHTSGVYDAAFSPDGERVFTVSFDDTVKVWNAKTGELIASLEHGQHIFSAAWSLDGTHIATSTQKDGLRIMNADGKGDPLVLNMPVPAIAMVFLDGGKKLLAVGSDNTTRTFTIDIDALKLALKQANADCLPPKMSVTYLGETDDNARARYDACERLHGRTVNRVEDASPREDRPVRGPDPGPSASSSTGNQAPTPTQSDALGPLERRVFVVVTPGDAIVELNGGRLVRTNGVIELRGKLDTEFRLRVSKGNKTTGEKVVVIGETGASPALIDLNEVPAPGAAGPGTKLRPERFPWEQE